MSTHDWKKHQCIDRAKSWEAILSSQGSLNESEGTALAEVREFIANAKAPNLLPDEDDDGDLRSRIGSDCVVSVTDDEGEFTVEVAYDGIEIEHSMEAVREEAVEIALAGLRVDWVRREIKRGTATATDVRMAIEEAEVCGWDGEDVTDLAEAFMLLADEDELDAYREAKLRRLIDAGCKVAEVFSLDPAVNGEIDVVERPSRGEAA